MPSDRDIPLPVSNAAAGSLDPWAMPDQEPSNLVVLCAGEHEPTAAAVFSALSRVHGSPIESMKELPPREAEMRWAHLVLPEDWATPLIVWVEPMRPMSAESLQSLNAESVKWAIGVETMLDANDPLSDFIRLLRLFGRAFPDSPAILNVNTEGWHTRDELDETLLPEEIEPHPSLLWIVHAIGEKPASEPDATVWVYTRGLARCGRPELEMLEVPAKYARVAAPLLSGIAELALEQPLPPPGVPMEIGEGLEVTLQPWREVATHLAANSRGSLENRKDHSGTDLVGVRAAVCGVRPIGNFRSIWSYPQEVLEQISSGGPSTIYRSQRATQRQTSLARLTWNDLMTAFAALPPKLRSEGPSRQAVFLVQAGYEVPRGKSHPADDPSGREHLWFEVLRCEPNRHARLVNAPAAIKHLRQGDVVWIDRGVISDWQVLTQRGPFGPDSVRALSQVVEQLKNASPSS
jgi:hypothetical protein